MATTQTNGNGNGKTLTRDEWVNATRHKTTVKVISATMAKEREMLGIRVTDYLAEIHGKQEVDEIRTHQSSDNEFHCVTFIIISHELAR